MKHVCITGAAALVLALASTPARAEQRDTSKQAPAEVTPAEARSWVALFDKVVDTVVTHREHCDAMALGLHVVIDAGQETIAMVRDAKAKGKRLPASVQQHMLEGMRKMVAALDRCGRDEKVAAEFKRIDLGGRR